MHDEPSDARDAGRWREHLRRRLAPLRLTPAREAEIVEEVSQHLDERYGEARQAGASDAEARRLVLDELEEPHVLTGSLRPLRQSKVPPPLVPGTPRRALVRDLWQDLRYAARMLKKEPGFTLAAVITLALGIGVNSAIFALVDAALLRPLPLPDSDRAVMVWEQTVDSSREPVAALNLADWHERSEAFEVLGGFVPNVGAMVTPGADGTPDTVSRQWVTWGVFDALGITPLAGRTFQIADDLQRLRAVVFGESLWRTRYNADPAVVGSQIRLDGQSWTVVGVVPDEAQIVGRASLWALVRIEGLPAQTRAQHSLRAVGRVKPGVALEAAQADLARVAGMLAREFPETNAGRGIALQPLREAVIGSDLRQTSMLFLAVVGLVLLICCANVANLFLTRATVRQQELAVRSALGADRLRLVRQLLTESVSIAAVGGALGLFLAAVILDAAPAVIPQELLPPAVAPALDGRVVLFCAATALGVGIVFGLMPAWRATEIASARALSSGGWRVTGHGGGLRRVLVAGQIAIAVVVLVAAGLLLRTLLAIGNVERGYQAEQVLTMVVDPLSSTYPSDEAELQFYDAVEQEVRSLPGVQDAAWATTLPMGRSYFGSAAVHVVGEPPPPGAQPPIADYQIVSPTYFRALDLPLVAGRPFDERDSAAGAQVCIVNEGFVRRHLQGRSPIGARVSVRFDDGPGSGPIVREIVGVARQVKGHPTELEEFVQIYVPLAQFTPGDVFLLVRSASGDAAALGASVRAAIARIDTQQLVSVHQLMTLDEVAGGATARHRFRAVLVFSFAVLALILATVGVFGVLAYTVQQRVRDFAVRRALGATAKDVFAVVAGDAFRMTAAGAAVGLAGAALLARLLASMLFGVGPLDVATFLTVTVVIALAGVAAAVGPAWRAVRVDPAVALRTGSG